MKTCAECAHVKIQKATEEAGFAFCGKMRSLIPQHFDKKTDPDHVYSTRVPAWCPMPKWANHQPSETPLPEAEWQPIPLTKV